MLLLLLLMLMLLLLLLLLVVVRFTCRLVGWSVGCCDDDVFRKQDDSRPSSDDENKRRTIVYGEDALEYSSSGSGREKWKPESKAGAMVYLEQQQQQWQGRTGRRRG
jgi:hypothetical protein